MKNTILALAIAAALASVSAEAATIPHLTGDNIPAGNSINDANLLPAAQLGKRTSKVAAVKPAQDANRVAMVEKCSMTPKQKGSAACEKMCGSAKLE